MTTTSSAVPTPPAAGSADSGSGRKSGAKRLSPLALVGLVGAVVVAGVLVARLLLSLFQPHLYAGTVLQSPTPAPDMSSLSLASGEPLDIAGFEGDVVLLYFGYTNCPDVCPTTLSTAARARQGLSPTERDRTHVMMISVDPARDPLDELQAYVEFFDPDFIGVSGNDADIKRAATQYGVFYALGDGTEASGYTVDHTANLLGIGPDGRLRVIWAPDVTSDALQSDIEELLS